MKNVILVLKGFFMGIANVIPGVSGGTIALILGIYEEFIGAINTIFKKFKENLKFLVPVFIGMGLSIITTSKIVGYSYEHYPLPTILFFVGLVFGGIPMLVRNVKGKRGSKNINNYIIALLTFALVIFMSSYELFFGMGYKVDFESMNLFGYILLFLVGVIAAATMVIPGISGSLVLMILGYYYPVINTINGVLINDVFHNLMVLGVLGIGEVVGIVLISKLIDYLFKKYKIKTYYGVLGFVVASIIAIPLSACSKLESIPVTIPQAIVAIILLVGGTLISYKLGDK